MKTPRGRQHASDVIATGQLTVPSEVENAIAEASALPEEDYQTTALEKMVDALDRVLRWEADAKARLNQLEPKDWRFTDRAGAEQSRTELLVMERAMDRTARVLASVSKMAIEQKQVALGKAQTELIVRILMSVITKMRLDATQTDMARAILLEQFRTEANLAPRVERKVIQELSPVVPVPDITSMPPEADPAMTGGVTNVVIDGRTVYSDNRGYVR